MNYKDLKKFEKFCKETGRPFTFEELKKWLSRSDTEKKVRKT